MMTVGFDVTSLAQNRYGGIATVCRHTLKQAAACPDLRATALYRRGSSENLNETGATTRRVSALDRFTFRRFDIVHALGHRIPPVRRRRLVYTLHDAWSLYPNRYQSSDFQARIGPRMAGELLRADAIVCDSRATLDALKGLSLVDSARCHVVYPGVETPSEQPDGPVPSRIAGIVSSNFVLFVGRIEVRKNLEHVVEAVRPLDKAHLVIVGEFGRGGKEIVARTLSRMPLDRLLLLSHVSDDELGTLYRRALAALQPSWEEGFGLPMLEAMAHGCPLITSNCSAQAEVAGDAAILVNPGEPGESSNALETLLRDPSARSKWAETGRRRSLKFTWSDYFQGLLGLYRDLS